MTVQRGYKYQIYPDEEQADYFARCFGCARFIWNRMLSDSMDFYYATDTHFIPTPARYKKKYPFLKEVDSLALANVQKHLEKAFKRFFEDPKVGHPQFKRKKTSKKSYTTNCQVPDSGIPTIELILDLDVQGIKLPKIGFVKAAIHRKPEFGGTLKSATVSQAADGSYFCSLLYEYNVPEPAEVLPTEENTIGLDYSSPNFYVDDQGHIPDAPHAFRKSQEKLAKMQRQLTRMVPGSRNYQEQKLKIQKLQRHIANQRKDFINKESRKIANSWGAVCVEDIDLKAMAQSLNLGKATLDNGFGLFRTALKYKLAEQGKHMIWIDRWYPSSKTCNHCGYINRDLTLKDRIWVCPICGELIERDTNAGKNIKAEGLREFYEGLQEQLSPDAVIPQAHQSLDLRDL